MDIVAHIRHQLSPLYPSHEADAIARMVSEDIFGISLKESLMGNASLSESQRERLEEVIKDLKNHVPVQYVVGYTSFCGHQFRVSPSVLIPRPETEELVALVLEDCQSLGNKLHICDAGTGSGCIAISLALALPDADVTALDISIPALDVARGNARATHASVHFMQADILNTSTLPEGPWNIIVSNPPYVMESERKDMDIQVLEHEPSQALFAPETDPLLFYRKLALWAKNSLSGEGMLYCEVNARLAEETRRMFGDYGFSKISVHKDQYGKNRFVRCLK